MLVEYTEFVKSSKFIREINMWLYRGSYYFAHLRANNMIELR